MTSETVFPSMWLVSVPVCTSAFGMSTEMNSSVASSFTAFFLAGARGFFGLALAFLGGEPAASSACCTCPAVTVASLSGLRFLGLRVLALVAAGSGSGFGSSAPSPAADSSSALKIVLVGLFGIDLVPAAAFGVRGVFGVLGTPSPSGALPRRLPTISSGSSSFSNDRLKRLRLENISIVDGAGLLEVLT